MGISTPDSSGVEQGVNGISPQNSANQGAQILSKALKYTNGNIGLALIYYNQGPQAVDWVKSHGYANNPAAGNAAFYQATGIGSPTYVTSVMSAMGN